MAGKPQHMHNLEIEIGQGGEMRILIDCPHRREKDAVTYEPDAALRMLAELEAEIRKSAPKKKPA